ncbi:MAG TPA: MBL fold metallo-hydrolase [Candidatus Nanoarchaeia archaeon]
MRVTKYPQSNFLIEEDSKKLLIDPGFLTFEKFKPSDFGAVQAILITHQHPDHLDKEAVKALSSLRIPIYGNSDVASLLSDESIEVNEFEPSKEFEVSGFKIMPIDLPHCKLLYCNQCGKQLTASGISPRKKCKLHLDAEPKLVDGPPNTGFVINGVLFHPGDGIKLTDLKVANACIPINGPTINFDRAWKLAASLEAKKVIPMHYSHPSFRSDPHEFAKKNPGGVEVVILDDDQSTEIS